jgi:uncharacterized membrane protein YvbJ
MKICSFCGEMIDDRAKACPVCGSDENTGWKPDYNLTDEDADFDPDFHERKSQGWLNTKKKNWSAWIFVIVIVLVIVAFLLRIF